MELDFRQLHHLQHPVILYLIPLLVLLPRKMLLLANYVCKKLLHVNPNSLTITSHLLHYIAKNTCQYSLGFELFNTEYWTRTFISVLHSQYSCSEATYTVSLQVYSFLKCICVSYRKVSYRSQNFQYVSYREACVSLHPYASLHLTYSVNCNIGDVKQRKPTDVGGVSCWHVCTTFP